MKDKEMYAIDKMILYIDKSVKYTEDMTYEDFLVDDRTQDATIFNISQIGEFVKNISDETKKKYDNIEWNMIKGLRNRIVHDYAGINLKNIWYIINNDLKPLKNNLEKMKKDY